MSDDQDKWSNAWDESESTVELDKAEVFEAVQRARREREAAAAAAQGGDGQSATTQQLPAIKHGPAQSGPQQGLAPGSGPHDTVRREPPVADAQTMNYAVPDDLLRRISESGFEDDEAFLPEVEVSLEELTDSEDDDDIPAVTMAEHVVPGQFRDELSSIRTAPAITRVQFEAVVDAQGNLKIPQEYLDKGRVRPGMTFVVVAIHKT